MKKCRILFLLLCLKAAQSLVRHPFPSDSTRRLSSRFQHAEGPTRIRRALCLGLRLNGGDNSTEVSESEDSQLQMSKTEGSADENDTSGNSTDSNANETKKPPPTPEMVQQMNFRLWEAAKDGNEPLLDKAIKAGANVNAFCRGPDKWINISVGELAGADEYSTGLNVHWMELNNYTALHLAAASGNAGIIDKLVEAGADIDAECLQRIHPMPTAFGSALPLLSFSKFKHFEREVLDRQPLIYKCTPLRLARAANCGRCFFTSYQKAVDKLVAYGALDTDFHFPLNTVVLTMAFGLAWAGLHNWPWAWFSEWPFDWYQYPDMQQYLEPSA